MVDFCGYQLPINYGSQIKEHEAVRDNAGMFDVSHMQILDLFGTNAKAFLRNLLSNDVNKLDKYGIGKALYSAMLNEGAGIIDDLIVYLLEDRYRIIANAATREKDFNWITALATKFEVTVAVRNDLSILAVQGPNAIGLVAKVYPELSNALNQLQPFNSIIYNNYLLARTGYTGENGLEILLPHNYASSLWEKLTKLGVKPCGLAARDTLRLEAGMNLYGHDMDETVPPCECGMDWVVDLSDSSRDFIGKLAYISLKENKQTPLQIGVLLEGKGVLREGQKIFINGNQVGKITSGTFSPTLKTSIAIARVYPLGDNATVDIRGNYEPIKFIKLPFVKNSNLSTERSKLNV
ncbi:MAG: glycine cleavage system aminomethyltransferase GcvT [Burkholderiales bacterium]|nr:glycine cleavage system aminomethyltransferase GcvT [Burkholderiales bacterium]